MRTIVPIESIPGFEWFDSVLEAISSEAQVLCSWDGTLLGITLLISGALLVGARLNGANLDLTSVCHPGFYAFSVRPGGVGVSRALGPVISRWPSAHPFERNLLHFVSVAELAAAANSDTNEFGSRPRSRIVGPLASHPVGNKNYLLYLFLAFSFLLATVVTLLWDIRRKSKSGKRGPNP